LLEEDKVSNHHDEFQEFQEFTKIHVDPLVQNVFQSKPLLSHLYQTNQNYLKHTTNCSAILLISPNNNNNNNDSPDR